MTAKVAPKRAKAASVDETTAGVVEWWRARERGGADAVDYLARLERGQELMTGKGWATLARLPDADAAHLAVQTLNDLALVLAGVERGEKSAVDALSRIRVAAVEQSSRYLNVVSLCEKFGDHEPGVLVLELARQVDPAFTSLSLESIARANAEAKDAVDFACRLILKANAIAPRASRETTTKHEKRIRGAMSDARSKVNVRRARSKSGV